MTTAQQTSGRVFEDVFQNIRKTAEAHLKMQQELFQQWSGLWPLPSTQTPWMERLRDFQKRWAQSVSELARRHKDVMQQQYQGAIESLEAALRIGEATTPEEYRRRSEQLCRKTLDCLREMSETQVKQFQDAVSSWTELAMKGGL